MLVSSAVSSLAPRTSVATAVSYVLLIGLCAGTMLVWLGEGAPFGRGLVEAVLRWNPLAAALSLIGAPGFVEYDLVPANWWAMLGIGGAALVVLVGSVWRLVRPR